MGFAKTAAAAAFLGVALAAATVAAAEDVALLARSLFLQDIADRKSAIQALKSRGNTDAVAPLIQALRFTGDDDDLIDALETLTGDKPGRDWHDWMLWQEGHPEIAPFDGFDKYKADVFALLDPNFRQFIYPGVAHDIRLEEITWGGVVKDGIPALVNPDLLKADDAGYLQDDELVFGVEIAGDARAYPLRIMDWHEMFNDVIGGVPVALAYCTLCGSGILFETDVAGRDEPFVFGSSGFLYRSNKLMYDRQTNSLWNQFTGRPVVGALNDSGIELKVRPVTITSWSAWHAKHPDTKVLSLETGHRRDYRPGRPYGEYFASAALMFPALLRDDKLQPKDHVFALRGGNEKAWPLTAFEGGAVINDRAGVIDLVLVGDAATRTVRAYRSAGRIFAKSPDGGDKIVSDGAEWAVEEAALIGPDGIELHRLPGHIAYWFAWSGFKGDRPVYQQ